MENKLLLWAFLLFFILKWKLITRAISQINAFSEKAVNKLTLELEISYFCYLILLNGWILFWDN